MEIMKIASAFKINGKVEKVEQITNGLINKTFKVFCTEKRYILQKINTGIFKNPNAIIQNHLKINKILSESDYPLEIVDLIETKDGDFLYFHDENVWRMTNYIENALSFDKVSSPEMAYEAVQALSIFYAKLNSNSTPELQEVLPDFLNFEKRIFDFHKSLEIATEERLQNAKDEINFILKHLDLPKKWKNIHKDGKIPIRVIHADPKISNILFNSQSKAFAVIDLDTLMNGSLLYDFGDMVRSYTNISEEDNLDFTQNFNSKIYEAIKKGFLEHLEEILTIDEVENLDLAAKTVIYIQAVRFLTDYLNNDAYYSTNYSLQNLNRTKNQINLLKGVMQFSKDL